MLLVVLALCGPQIGGAQSNTINLVAKSSRADLPVGKKVRLFCTHDDIADPRYVWFQNCGGGPGGGVNEAQVTPTFVPSPLSAGAYTFTVNVNGSTDSVDVTAHMPNRVKVEAGPTSISRRTLMVRQIVKVVPFWNDEAIGKGILMGQGADGKPRFKGVLRVQETWSAKSKHELFGDQEVERGIKEWWPENAPIGNHSAYPDDNAGNVDRAHGFTWVWKSPTLRDHWETGAGGSEVDRATWLKLIQSIDEDKPVMEKEHVYRFQGTRCGGNLWSKKVKVQCRLFVKKLKPTHTLKFPVWEIYKVGDLE